MNSTVQIKLSKTGGAKYTVCLLRQSALVSGGPSAHLLDRPSTPRARELHPTTPRSSPLVTDAREPTVTQGVNSSSCAMDEDHPVDVTLKLGLSFSFVGRGEHGLCFAQSTFIRNLHI